MITSYERNILSPFRSGHKVTKMRAINARDDAQAGPYEILNGDDRYWMAVAK